MSQNEPYNQNDLLRRVINGDEAAFAVLYEKYKSRLYTYILKYITVPSISEDILQEVFMKIWEVRGRINPDLSFTGYLYRISRNKVFNTLKRVALDDEMRLKVMQQLGAVVTGAEEKLQWDQYNNLLQAAINEMPTQRRNVFSLCRTQGMTYEQAATQLGISHHTVKEHLAAAVKDIKEYFVKYGDMALLLMLLAYLEK